MPMNRERFIFYLSIAPATLEKRNELCYEIPRRAHGFKHCTPNDHLDNSIMVDNKYFTGKIKFDNIIMMFRKIRQATSQLRLLSRTFENSKIFVNRFDLLPSLFLQMTKNPSI